MGLRSRIASLVSGPVVEAVDAPVRVLVEDLLAERPLVRPGELAAIGAEIADLRDAGTAAAASPAAARLEALERDAEALKIELTEAMGAITALTTRLSDARRAANGASTAARDAGTQAAAAAERAQAAADAIARLEARLATFTAASPPASE